MKPGALSFSLAGISYLGTSYMTMDCQEFVEKTLRKVGISKNLPGSNAWYREMTWVGSPEECTRRFGSIPKGAFLFILEQDGKEPAKYRGDGIGNASHIGIYTGLTGRKMVEMATATGNQAAASCDYGDGAIHSSMSRGCVATSKFAGKSINGGWNRVGLWDDLDWGEEINQMLTGASDAAGNGGDSDDSSGSGGADTYTSATVWAENGLPVKMRQSKDRKNRLFGIYDEYPVGTEVEVLKAGDEWSKIRIGSRTGWMMTQFLKTWGTEADRASCCNEDYGESEFTDSGDGDQGNVGDSSFVPVPGTSRTVPPFPSADGASACSRIAALREKMKELMEAIDEWLEGGDDH